MHERAWVGHEARVRQRRWVRQRASVLQRVWVRQRGWVRERAWVWSSVILFLLFGASFIFTSSSDAGGQLRGRPRRSPSSTSDDMNKGLQFRLSEGVEQTEHREQPGPAQAAALPESDSQSL